MRWPLERMGNHVRFLPGFAFKSDRFNSSGDGLPLVRIRDVVPGRSDTYYSGPFDDRFVVEDGDYLIGMDGEFNLARWRGGRALLNQRVCKIDRVSSLVDIHYLARFLPIVLKKIEDATPFATVKHLSTKVLNEVDLPVPPMEEQRRIADILDRADALRAKRRVALAHLDDLTQSIFFDMFGDPNVAATRYPVRAIGDLIDSAAYGTSARAGAVGRFPVLRMGNLTADGRIDLTDLKYMDLSGQDESRYLVQRGDVLFNRTNSPELVGKTAVYRSDRPVAFAGYLVRLRTNAENHPEYLSAFMNTAYMKRVLRSMCKTIIGMANINARELQAIRIGVPPYPQQVAFAERIAIVDQAVALHRRNLTELDALFASLQDRAFKGEL